MKMQLMRDLRQLYVTGVLAGIFLLVCGCGSERAPVNPKPIVPVSGVITINGEPQKGVFVSFHPKVADPGNFTASNGKTDDEGNFKAWTYRMNDGVPPGDYVVTFYYPDPKIIAKNRPDLLQNRYVHPQNSTHMVTVPTEGELVMDPIDLQM